MTGWSGRPGAQTNYYSAITTRDSNQTMVPILGILLDELHRLTLTYVHPYRAYLSDTFKESAKGLCLCYPDHVLMRLRSSSINRARWHTYFCIIIQVMESPNPIPTLRLPLPIPREGSPLTLGVYASFIVIAVTSVSNITGCILRLYELRSVIARHGFVMHCYRCPTRSKCYDDDESTFLTLFTSVLGELHIVFERQPP